MSQVEVRSACGTRITVGETGFGVFNEEVRVGFTGAELVVEVDGCEQTVRFDSAVEVAGGIDAEGPVGESLLRCRTAVRLVPELDAVTVRHTLVNPTDRAFRVAGIETRFCGLEQRFLLGAGDPMYLRYCHTDNVRTERYPYCLSDYPYVRPLPARTVVAGTGEDQPFPAIYFTGRDYACGLVLAATSQERCYPSWEFLRTGIVRDCVFERFVIHHELAQVRGVLLAARGELAVDGTFVEIVRGTHPQDAYVDYVNFLAERFVFQGQTTPLLDQAFYCSWNYGVFQDQYEERLLKTARFMKENFPRITFFLMDAGYVFRTMSKGRESSLSGNFMDRFYPDANGQVDPEKFPHGIRHFSDALREMGLRPGIWWSPTASFDSTLFKDHPDWFLRNADGGYYRIGTHLGFLDYSQGGPCKLVDDMLGVILDEWNMDAVKMDFWSQNFEDRDARLAGCDVTAAQARTKLFEIIRRHLPEDGVFMTCVATGMGDPFVGLHADTYRNTIDIGAGVWREQVRNCLWALPTLGFEGRKTLLLNNDSFGFNLDCPDNENLFRMTWGFITMGMQEIGGRLEELPERYVRALRKFTDRCDRGYRCLCADERAFTGEPFPRCLHVNYPEESPTRKLGVVQSLAFFNWSDEPRMVTVRRDALGHSGPVTAVNFWTEERERFADEFIVKRLEPRSALLYDVLETS